MEHAVGHSFADRSLLERALTHDSAIKDVSKRAAAGYQRLEFLGDRVLGLVVADMLFHAHPDLNEGAMAKRFTQLVRGETCADVALGWGLGGHIRSGGQLKQGNELAAATQSMLGDACEAVLGAVYIDAGFDAARRVVERAWTPRLAGAGASAGDPKTALQEWAQARGLPPPDYRMAERSGPDHAPTFLVDVHVRGLAPERGTGAAKRDAQQDAAHKVLLREKIWVKA